MYSLALFHRPAALILSNLLPIHIHVNFKCKMSNVRLCRANACIADCHCLILIAVQSILYSPPSFFVSAMTAARFIVNHDIFHGNSKGIAINESVEILRRIRRKVGGIDEKMNDARGCEIEMEWGEWKWGCEDVKGVRSRVDEMRMPRRSIQRQGEDRARMANNYTLQG